MRPGSVVAVALLSTVTITTPGHAAPTAKVWTCMRPAIKPQRIYLWCYHADIWTQGMRWSRRTARTVTASGDYVVNTCAISCAEGPFLKYPARFTFSRPEMVKAFRGYQTALRRNATMFTRVRVSFSGAPPDGWTGQPYILVKERNPGTGSCELVWEHRGEKYKPC